MTRCGEEYQMRQETMFCWLCGDLGAKVWTDLDLGRRYVTQTLLQSELIVQWSLDHKQLSEIPRTQKRKMERLAEDASRLPALSHR